MHTLKTLLPTAFYVFLSCRRGIFSHTPENNAKIIWLIWNLVHLVISVRRLRTQNFRRLALRFFEIWLHKVRVLMQQQFIMFRYLPPEFVFNIAKITFYDHSFSDPKLYLLHISAIFNKKKIFSWPLIWKMTAATIPGGLILLKLSHKFSEPSLKGFQVGS